MISGWTVRWLVRHRTRTLLAIAGVAVSAALLLDMVLLSRGMEISFARLVLARGFQIRIAPKGTLPFDTEALIPAAGEVVGAVRRDPRVAAAGAVVVGTLFLERDSLVPVTAYGIDPLAQGLYTLEEGQDLLPGDSAGAVVGVEVSRALGLVPGDTMALAGRLDPLYAGARLERRVVVRGLVRWIADARNQLTVGTLLPVMQHLGPPGGTDQASAILVQAAADSNVQNLAADLARTFPHLTVNSLEGLVERFRGRLAYFRQVASILGTISLLVTILLVGTIATITVNERMGEIAIQRVIGIGRGRILGQVLWEGVLVTLVGGTVGVGLGLATARILDRILKDFPGLPQSVSFFIPDVRALVVAGALLLAAGVLAGVYPGWLAVRAPMAATLRGEET